MAIEISVLINDTSCLPDKRRPEAIKVGFINAETLLPLSSAASNNCSYVNSVK